MAKRLAVSGRTYLVADIFTDVKRATRSNTFGMTFPFFSLSLFFLFRLNPEIWRFAYSDIRWEDFEGTLCYFLIDEASVDAYSLTFIWCCTVLDCFAWCIHTILWALSEM